MKNPFLIEQLPVYQPNAINRRSETVGRGRFIMQNALYAAFNQAVQTREQNPINTYSAEEPVGTEQTTQPQDAKGQFANKYVEFTDRNYILESARTQRDAAFAEEQSAQHESIA